MPEAWTEQARWEWVNPATEQLHAVWIDVGVDPETDEITTWRVSARTRRGREVNEADPMVFNSDVDHGALGDARTAAHYHALAYRGEFGGLDVADMR